MFLDAILSEEMFSNWYSSYSLEEKIVISDQLKQQKLGFTATFTSRLQ